MNYLVRTPYEMCQNVSGGRSTPGVVLPRGQQVPSETSSCVVVTERKGQSEGIR